MTGGNENDRGSLGELVSLKGSPWSLRAKWALTHHRCQYSETDYIPFVSVPRLWFRLSFPRDKITAPVFFPIDQSPPLRHSLAIARLADKKRSLSSDSIFPPNADSEIESWVQCAESVMTYDRHRFVRKVLKDEETTLRLVPENMRWIRNFGALRVIRWVLGTKFLGKYPVNADAEAEAHRSWSAVLQRLHEEKRNGSNKQAVYLVGGRFTFADIAIASATTVVAPPNRKILKGIHDDNELVRDDDFCDKFGEIIQWRDDIFERHFPESMRHIPRQR